MSKPVGDLLVVYVHAAGSDSEEREEANLVLLLNICSCLEKGAHDSSAVGCPSKD